MESEQANGSTIVNGTTQHDKIPQTDPEQADEPSDCKPGKTSSSGQDTSINAVKHHWIHVSYSTGETPTNIVFYSCQYSLRSARR